MLVLGIESSCDETAAALVDDQDTIIANVVASQAQLHREHGGVVPELASRQHIRHVIPVVEEALRQGDCTLEDIDGIAVTYGPGLVGSLLVGLQAAKAIAFASNKPLVGINHLEGHLVAPRLCAAGAAIPERHMALLVSGGHTALFVVETFGQYRRVGTTRDDAAGEAFDKVAKLLGLGYPGGPQVEKVARAGDPAAIAFPRALPRRDSYDFSFSGLKTAVANYLRQQGELSEQQRADLCASFQQAVSDVLVKKTVRAARARRVKAVVASGGVMANQAIREALNQGCAEADLAVAYPPIALCTDNAAMIAAAGWRRLQRGERSPWSINAQARCPLP